VTGSLLGLDLALAPLALRRLGMDVPESPPRVPSLEREGFAMNVAMLDPRRLTDADRDRIGLAVARGRARVTELRAQPQLLRRVSDDLALDGWQERALRWALQSEPGWVDNHFSLADLVVLGGGLATLDAWGANGLVSMGCLCTRLPEPGLWRVLAGRPQAAMLAAATVDLNLELAQRFAEMRLPAPLLPSVLTTAMQELIDRAAPTDPNDLAALARYVRTIPAHAVEDYVAAAATLDGPLVADADAETSREH
jgi:hypothetical protein